MYKVSEYKVVDEDIAENYSVKNKGNKHLHEWLAEHADLKEKPYLIITDYYELEKTAPEVIKEKFQLKEKKKDSFSFLLNSSIWIRLSKKIDFEEFKWFEDLGLYSFKSAKEFIDYHYRVQEQNYLAESHGAYITPVIYSNEMEFRDFFFGENDDIQFKFLKNSTIGKKGDFYTKNVALRILMIDDKIEMNEESSNDDNHVYECEESCSNCPYKKSESDVADKEPCKLNVIRKLLSGDFIGDEKKKELFHEKTYWANADENNDSRIKSYYVDKVKISDVWERNPDSLNIENRKEWLSNWNSVIDCKSSYTQIVGVRDLESALALMSCCKFDIILLDYLLGERSDDDPERTYSTELFEFLSYDFNKKPDSDIVTMLKTKSGFDDYQLKQFRDEVKLNRGPLDKYWIVPMTSYNSSFLSDLQRRNVRLIDHRWNISQGADPINTPWRFLYKLNEFVDLQLRSSVYWKKQLMTFIRYTCEDFKTRFEKIPEERVFCFEEFQQFMGAEYANYMKRYGARKFIERDAALEGDNSNKSLFATYIARNFYNDPKFSIETELNRLMQSFYHQAATMFNDRYGLQRLRIAFEQMRMFIVYNKLEKESESPKELLSGLCFLYAVIDSEFECDKIKDWLNNSMNRRGSDV